MQMFWYICTKFPAKMGAHTPKFLISAVQTIGFML